MYGESSVVFSEKNEEEKYRRMALQYHFTVEATKVLHIATLVEESFHLKWKNFGDKLFLEENPRTGRGEEGGVREKTYRNTEKPLPLEFISLNQDI